MRTFNKNRFGATVSLSDFILVKTNLRPVFKQSLIEKLLHNNPLFKIIPKTPLDLF